MLKLIKRKDIYLCCDTRRHIYELPLTVNRKFADAMSAFGELTAMDLGDSILWVVKFEDKMQLRFESGKNSLDVRIHRKIYREKINYLEAFLKQYFDALIERES